jgi:hypothetical protein
MKLNQFKFVALLTALASTGFNRRRILSSLMTVLLLTACAGTEGPTGPTGSQGNAGAQGPTGPVGPQGASGPGTRLTIKGTTDSQGGFAADLPASAGTIDNPPLITCYLALSLPNGNPDPNGWYVPSSPTFCGFGGSNGKYGVFMYRATVRWPAMFVVVY